MKATSSAVISSPQTLALTATRSGCLNPGMMKARGAVKTLSVFYGVINPYPAANAHSGT
jgi:hypothetical protein